MVLSAVFLVPLLAGIYLSTGTNRRSVRANQVSHDLASMYAQGVDFSQAANQNIARRLLDPRDGKTLIILSRVRMVTPSDCGGSGQCANNGYPVIVQRIVIGDPELHASTLGSPMTVDRASGNVSNWAADASARVVDGSVSLRAGEYSYAAEAFICGIDDQNGVYARALF